MGGLPPAQAESARTLAKALKVKADAATLPLSLSVPEAQAKPLLGLLR